MDTLISNVTIVTMNEKMDVLFGAFLGIKDGKIASVSKVAPKEQPATIIDGTGMVVAVLDTGLDSNHTAFSVNNFKADRDKLGMSFADVQALVGGTKASQLHTGLTASDVYLNEKVPFAFDYADYDPDVYPMTPAASDI